MAEPIIDAFILFNEQESVVESIVGELESRGISTHFWRRDVPIAEKWNELETQRLKDAGTVLVFLGTAEWGPNHLRLTQEAQRINKRIIPVLIGDVPETAYLEADGLFRDHRYLDLRKPDSEALTRLVEAIHPNGRSQAHQYDRIVSVLVDGNEEQRAGVLRQIRTSRSIDRRALAARLQVEIRDRFGPLNETQFASAVRDPKKTSSIRSWMLSSLIWADAEGPDSRRLILEHMEESAEPDRNVRYWALAGLYQSNAAYLIEAVKIALNDDAPEVAALAQAISSPTDPQVIEQFRSKLFSSEFQTVWQVLRLLRVVPIPDLAGDVCAQLERSVEGSALAYDALYALTHPTMARQAAKILSEKPGVNGVVARVIAEARSSNENAARSFTSLLAAFDNTRMDRALAEAERDPETRNTAQLLREYLNEHRRDEPDEKAPTAGKKAALQLPELDPVSFFGRLSLSSRRALANAEAIRLNRKRDEIHLEYLIAGLFENEEGPTRRILVGSGIDGRRLAELIEQSGGFTLPWRSEYKPAKLPGLPVVTPRVRQALQAARDIADSNGAAQIQSRHLLYGALSINDSKLVTLLAQAGVRQEDVPLTEVVAEASFPLQTIARLNSDNAEGDDLLGIDADVNALAAVIAVRDVATPLSIGLFGDWGSGKSFFMGKLRKRIFELRDMARAAEGNSAYCDNVVQIEFNAWSYQEGDLWASLVTDIFESLAQSIDTDAGLSRETERATAKARLLASMASAGDVLADQEQKRDAAEKELHAGEQQFEALKKIGPKDVIREAYRAAAAEPEVKKRLDAAADQLNIPEAERALGDLKVELLEIKHLWSAIPLAFKGWNRPRDWIIALAVMAAVALLAFVGVPLVLHYQLDSKIASLVALLSLAVGRLAPVIKKAKDVTATIKGIRDSQQQRIETQQEQMRKKLADAQLRVQHAKENLQNLEQGLQEMRADTQLLNFVRQRRLSTDYTSRLGTVARARRDFKQLSDLMDQARLEHQGQATQNDKKEVALALPRIDRIVLYIDDLDRCSEDKVVKVLEAVHLLLAFKLFVVIVAVDSRWLLHSLRQHSAAFRTSNDGAAGISDEELAHWESTPLNYLEKIFQIPFYLRPMRERGFNRLVHSVIGEVLSESVDDHLEKSPEKGAEGHAIEDAPEQQLQHAIQGGKAGVAPDPTPETASSAQPAKTVEVAGAVSVGTNEAFSTTPKDGSGDKVDAETQGDDIQAQAEALKALPKEQKPNGAAAEANPAALQLREWERDFMKKLHPLIMSPRSAKRFINIYRLMRVSITNERDLAAFVGSKQGGQHRAALLLLAILTGYPAEATDILRDLLEEERPETWWQYIDGLEARWTSTVKPSSGSGSISTQRRRGLMDKLRLLRGEIHENQSCDQFVKWASKVARYSFESGRVLALTNDETDTD